MDASTAGVLRSLRLLQSSPDGKRHPLTAFFRQLKIERTAGMASEKKAFTDLNFCILRSVFRVGFHHRTAFFAGSQWQRTVKTLVMWKEIGLYVVQFKVYFVEFVVAVFAEPQ